ncbi:Heat stress transcription factor A-5 [Rhynchospora pubera]|uniref:Heat stress transcription factor A-5 n=1 Tax=Rhynchospora pubera TaxID=906938 RepID=A0AAV8D6Q5_9POAL|nr:Heat stress transcription factor A-5 [Rhynchospora pubera]
MEGAQGGGGGGGGPAPFLVKTYEMIDDPSTNDIVSWCDTGASFVVWDPPEFAARLLPTYFKHNNFSSFIRQLNTYGFRKTEPDRWEFANEHFIRGKKHLLKSIHRRKPIHSHSQPSVGAGSLPETERAALEEEIDRLTRERLALQNELLRFRQQQSGTEMQIGDIERRIQDMEQRQLKMIAFLHKASSNTRFMDNLIKMANSFPGPTALSVPSPGLPGLPDSSIITDSLHRKRQLPSGEEMEYSPELESCHNNNNFTSNNNNSLYEDHCSSSSSGRTDFSLVNQSFDKLKLGLCPAMAAMSTHSSNEEEDNVGAHVRISDTGTSLFPLKSTLLAGDGHLSSLDLTLASYPSMEMTLGQDLNTANISPMDEREDVVCNGIESGIAIRSENRSGTENVVGNGEKVGSQNGSGGSQEDAVEKEEPVAPPARVNDVFWEQFLTERPGCDSEEASSGLRSNPNPSPSGESREECKEMQKLKL